MGGGGGAKVSQDLVDDLALGNRRDDAGAPAALLTVEDVKGEGSFESIRPMHGRTLAVVSDGVVSGGDGLTAGNARPAPMGGDANDVGALLGVSGEPAEVGDLVLARCRNEQGNAANEALRREGEDAGAVREGPFHFEGHHGAIEAEPLLSDGGTQDVAK